MLWNIAPKTGTTTEDAVRREFDASLDKLGLDYVDLYLIHWPRPNRDSYPDVWRGLETIAADGRAKAIGVSNFKPAHLERLIAETSVVPAINQIELHPRFQQADSRAFHAKHSIQTEAWSPIGQGKGLLDDPTIAAIAGKHERSPAQVVLRWHMQLGNVAIPKSVTPARIRENLDVFGFELDADDLAAIGTLDSSGGRIGPDPDDFDV